MGITYEDMNDETEEGYALLSQYVDELSSRQGALKDYIKKSSFRKASLSPLISPDWWVIRQNRNTGIPATLPRSWLP